MKFKTFLGMILFTIAMAGAFLTQLHTAEASTTVLAVDPRYIADPTLHSGSIFRINITVADVQLLEGFQFVLSYYTNVLTATSYGLFLPFNEWAPSEINDAQGYVALAALVSPWNPTGLATTDPKPICWIEFQVDSYGSSGLYLHNSILADVHGNAIPHEALSGFFNPPTAPVPEFPIGLVIELAFAPLLIYLYWKRKAKPHPPRPDPQLA